MERLDGVEVNGTSGGCAIEIVESRYGSKVDGRWIRKAHSPPDDVLVGGSDGRPGKAHTIRLRALAGHEPRHHRGRRRGDSSRNGSSCAGPALVCNPQDKGVGSG